MVIFGTCVKSNLTTMARNTERNWKEITIHPLTTEWERLCGSLALLCGSTSYTMPVYDNGLSIRTFMEKINPGEGDRSRGSVKLPSSA